ncbi:MAG TPA: hypothetical protein VK678_23610, partial [Bradyrhizobium sp.]|nr:hypothetical protein [Bradyrhizobium sp.]
MPQRAGFRGLHQLPERFALEPHSLLVRHGDGSRDCVDAFERCREISRRRADRVSSELEESVRVSETYLHIPHAPQRTPFRRDSAGERHGPRQQIALDHLIEERGLFELLR